MAATLTLPPPVNRFAGEDLSFSNGMNGTDSGSSTPGGGSGKKSEELLKGMIYPSREIRSIIDKTAIHVAKSPQPQILEDRIREHQKQDPKFSFLRDGDAFNRYYRYMIEKVKEDGEEAVLASSSGAQAQQSVEGNFTQAEGEPDGQAGGGVRTGEKVKRLEETVLEEPKPFEFAIDLPNVTALDLDILRLTALFVAKRGRGFLASLSVREGRNFQFDFLRPTHSLFGYFNRMVEHYIKIMAPPEELLAELELDPKKGGKDKWELLESAKKRGQWEKVKQEKEKKRQEEKEREVIAFAEIDWQDFALVQTIEFTSTDTQIELPPPTTVRAMQLLSLNEKRMAALIVEEAGEEADEEAERKENGEMDVDMEEESEDEEVKAEKKREQEELERARAIQAKALGQAGMKIRKDYMPKARQQAKVATTICPYCQQSIPENEISEHIRIELLDPRWKEQKELMDRKRTQAAQLMQNADVAASLRQLASARTDLFGTAEDEERRRREEEEERAQRRAKESIVWDGHLASKATTLDTFQSKFSLDEQIKGIHNRLQLLPKDQTNAPGPQLGLTTAGPAAIPPAQAAGARTPEGGTAFSGATISAGPSAPSAASFRPAAAPYDSYQSYSDQPMFDPSMFSLPPMPIQQEPILDVPLQAPPPQAGLPPKPGAPMADGLTPGMMGGASPAVIGSPAGSPMPPQLAGQIRPHEGDDVDGPAAKRPRMDGPPSAIPIPEHQWLAMNPNPVTVLVQLPNMPEQPEWKLNGSVIELPDTPLNLLFSRLRDRIKYVLDADLPMARMQINWGGKAMKLGVTLASVNVGNGGLVQLIMKKK